MTSDKSLTCRESVPGLRLRRVRRETETTSSSIKLELFRSRAGRVCGWYIGPIAITPQGATMPYLARGQETMASVAIVRALETAKRARTDVCIVDPNDLWTQVWPS